MAKDKDYKRMIHTARWLRLRRAALSQHPLCVRCEKEGFITAAKEVHHRVPVETATTVTEKERLMFDPMNLTPLCHDCHVRIHTEMGRSGKEQTRQRNDDHTKEIIDRFFK